LLVLSVIVPLCYPIAYEFWWHSNGGIRFYNSDARKTRVILWFAAFTAINVTLFLYFPFM